MRNANIDKQLHSTRRAKRTYIAIQVAHDFAYFGFITIQTLIVKEIFEKLGFGDSNALAWTIGIISLHLICQFFLEIPTGATADNRGRMRVVRTSFFARTLAVVCLLIAFLVSVSIEKVEISTEIYILVFALLILVQVLMATAESLFTGSIEAWLVDTLEYYDSSDQIGATFSSVAFIQNIAIFVAIPLLLLLYFNVDFGYNDGNKYFTLFLITAIFTIAAFIAHKSRDEEYRQSIEWESRKKATLADTWRQSKELILSSNIILWCMILVAAPLGAWILVSWMWTILLKPSLSIKLEQNIADNIITGFGLILCVARIGGSWFCRHIQNFVNPLEGLRLALLLNLSILFLGAIGLLISQESIFVQIERSSPLDPIKIHINAVIFAVSLLIAKAIEEIVKIFTQIVLANIITDSTIRATAISIFALASNFTAFIFIIVAVSISYVGNVIDPSNKVGIIVGIVSLAGLLLAFIASKKLFNSIQNISSNENHSVHTKSNEDFIDSTRKIEEDTI